MVIFSGLIAIVLFVAAAWAGGVFRKKTEPDIGPALRQLLLDKQQGTLNQAAFEQAQAALHERLLSGQSAGAQDPKAKLRAGVLAAGGVVAVVIAVVSWNSPSASGALPASAPGGFGGAGAPGMTLQALPGASDAPKGGDLNNLVTGLAQKMEKDPSNGQGWLLLARTYGELRQYEQAAKAYERAASLLPPEAQMLADWADAHVMAHDRVWDDKARDMVKRAVKADPKNAKALTLAGSEAFDRKQYKAAIDFWKRSIAVEPPNSMGARLAESNIQEATALLNGKTPSAAANAPAPIAGKPAAGAVGGSPDGQLKWRPAP